MAKICIWTTAVLVGMVLIAHSRVKCEDHSNKKGISCVNAESDDSSVPRCRPLEPEEPEDAANLDEYEKVDKLPGDSDERDQMVRTSKKNSFVSVSPIHCF